MGQVRLRRGVLRADIVPDRFAPVALYHYIVQRQGSNEILAWGQEHSRHAAIEAAERNMERLEQDRVA